MSVSLVDGFGGKPGVHNQQSRPLFLSRHGYHGLNAWTRRGSVEASWGQSRVQMKEVAGRRVGDVARDVDVCSREVGRTMPAAGWCKHTSVSIKAPGLQRATGRPQDRVEGESDWRDPWMGTFKSTPILYFVTRPKLQDKV